MYCTTLVVNHTEPGQADDCTCRRVIHMQVRHGRASMGRTACLHIHRRGAAPCNSIVEACELESRVVHHTVQRLFQCTCTIHSPDASPQHHRLAIHWVLPAASSRTLLVFTCARHHASAAAAGCHLRWASWQHCCCWLEHALGIMAALLRRLLLRASMSLSAARWTADWCCTLGSSRTRAHT